MTAGTVNINVSDPTNPEIMANQYQQPDMQQINSLWKDDNTLFAAGGTDGILALDYTAPLSPVQDWSIAPGATTVAFQMKAVSNKLYVANKGIFIYDITNAASPSLLGSNTTGCTEARSIEVSGNYAYVGCEGTGVRIYDISNPASPTSVATIATTGLKARGLKIVETTLYVATAGSGFRSYNISDPLNPSQIGSVSTSGGCYKIDVQGTTAFCGDNNSGVTAINISTPGSPSVISTYQPGGGTELNVQAEGNALFVSSLSEFFIIDISDTSSMSTLGSITPRDDVRGFGLSGNTLYISDSLRGMSIWDVTSRTTPIELGSMDFTDTNSTHGVTDVYPLGKYFFATSYGTTSLFGASMTLQSSGVATSGAVDTTSDTIKHATLSITENKPTGTGITYQMSANGGTNWESVTPDVEHDFTNTGSDLRWQATLSTTDTTATPTISSLSIAYETYRVPNQPTITVTDDITQVQLASSTFSGDITHSSSDWEIYDSSTLSAGNLVAYSYNNASALTSIDMADGAFTFQNALSGRDRLRPNNNYWARVRHTNAQGSSSWSSTVSFTAQNQAPGSSTIPTQTWSEDTTETGPDLNDYFTDPDETALTYSVLTADTPSNIDVEIDEDGIVTFTPDADWFGSDTVTFVADDETTTGNSNQVTLTVTNVNDPPEAPENFDITGGGRVSSLRPTLSWQAATDIDNTSNELSYIVRISKDADPINNAHIQVTTGQGDERSSLTSDLEDETLYYYAVKTVDADDAESDWSAVQSFYLNTALTPDLVVTKSTEQIQVANVMRPFTTRFFENILQNFIRKAQADTQETNDPESIPAWVLVLQSPWLTYVFLGLIAISVLYILVHSRVPQNITAVLFLPPHESFARISPKDEHGTWKTSFASYERKTRVTKQAFIAGTFLLIGKIFLTGVLGALFSPAIIPSLSRAEGETLVTPGSRLQYTITYENTGDAMATNVIISDTIPSPTTLLAKSINFDGLTGLSPEDNENITLSGNTLRFNVGAVGEAGQETDSGTISFQVEILKQIASDVSFVSNTANYVYDGATNENTNTVSNILPNSYVGGKIYVDKNGDEDFDDKDAPVENADFTLYKNTDDDNETLGDDDTLWQSGSSDAAGDYIFHHIGQGVYFIVLNEDSISLNTQAAENQEEEENASYRIDVNTSTGFVSADNDFIITETGDSKKPKVKIKKPKSDTTEESQTDTTKDEETDISEENEADAAGNAAEVACDRLSVQSINGQTQNVNHFEVQNNTVITVKGETCANAKLIASYRDVKETFNAHEDGSWDWALRTENIKKDSLTVNISLLENPEISRTVTFTKNQSVAKKVQNAAAKSLSAVAEILNINGDTPLSRFEIPLILILIALLAYLLYRLMDKKEDALLKEKPKHPAKKKFQ